jgi:hypothetical protein
MKSQKDIVLNSLLKISQQIPSEKSLEDLTDIYALEKTYALHELLECIQDILINEQNVNTDAIIERLQDLLSKRWDRIRSTPVAYTEVRHGNLANQLFFQLAELVASERQLPALQCLMPSLKNERAILTQNDLRDLEQKNEPITISDDGTHVIEILPCIENMKHMQAKLIDTFTSTEVSESEKNRVIYHSKKTTELHKLAIEQYKIEQSTLTLKTKLKLLIDGLYSGSVDGGVGAEYMTGTPAFNAIADFDVFFRQLEKEKPELHLQFMELKDSAGKTFFSHLKSLRAPRYHNVSLLSVDSLPEESLLEIKEIPLRTLIQEKNGDVWFYGFDRIAGQRTVTKLTNELYVKFKFDTTVSELDERHVSEEILKDIKSKGFPIEPDVTTCTRLIADSLVTLRDAKENQKILEQALDKNMFEFCGINQKKIFEDKYKKIETEAIDSDSNTNKNMSLILQDISYSKGPDYIFTGLSELAASFLKQKRYDLYFYFLVSHIMPDMLHRKINLPSHVDFHPDLLEIFQIHQIDPMAKNFVRANELCKAVSIIKSNPDLLKFASFEFNKHLSFFKRIAETPLALCFLPEEWKNDKGFVDLVVKKDPASFKYASDEFRKDKDFVFSLIRDYGIDIFKYASDDLRKDKDFVFLLIRDYGVEILEYASDDLRKDEDFVLLLIRDYGVEILEYASDTLKNDDKFVFSLMEACKGSESRIAVLFQQASQSLKANENFVIKILKEFNLSAEKGSLLFFTKAFKNNESFLLRLMAEKPLHLQYLSEEEKTQKIVLKAVQQDVMAFDSAPKKLTKDKEIIMVVFNNLFKSFSEDRQKDEDFYPVLEAMALFSVSFRNILSSDFKCTSNKGYEDCLNAALEWNEKWADGDIPIDTFCEKMMTLLELAKKTTKNQTGSTIGRFFMPNQEVKKFDECEKLLLDLRQKEEKYKENLQVLSDNRYEGS